MSMFMRREHVIDQQYIGTASRFMNHSETPNCVFVPVLVNTVDPDTNRPVYYEVILFALVKSVNKGDEFTINYSPKWFESRSLAASE